MRSTGLVSKARALISFDNYIVLAAINGWSYSILKPELSHQHPGFNGEIVNERFDLLSSENHRLYITEFDSKHYNISERPLPKPLLKASLVQQQALRDSTEVILEHINRNEPDEQKKRKTLPDSVHLLLGASDYNMRRQINRMKAWIHIESSLNRNNE